MGGCRYFVDHASTIEHLGVFIVTTLGSLVHRAYLDRRRTGITITSKGVETWQMYHRALLNYRQKVFSGRFAKGQSASSCSFSFLNSSARDAGVTQDI